MACHPPLSGVTSEASLLCRRVSGLLGDSEPEGLKPVSPGQALSIAKGRRPGYRSLTESKP